jgi:hypothetical protein
LEAERVEYEAELLIENRSTADFHDTLNAFVAPVARSFARSTENP